MLTRGILPVVLAGIYLKPRMWSLESILEARLNEAAAREKVGRSLMLAYLSMTRAKSNTFLPKPCQDAANLSHSPSLIMLTVCSRWLLWLSLTLGCLGEYCWDCDLLVFLNLNLLEMNVLELCRRCLFLERLLVILGVLNRCYCVGIVGVLGGCMRWLWFVNSSSL